MRSRTLVAVAASLGIVLAACGTAATPSPTTSKTPASVAPTSAGSVAPPSVEPSSNLPTAIGPGEGELDIIVWAGYAEDGANVKEYDWVHPFIAANPDCAKVNIKPADTSDAMVSLMQGGGGGLYDGVSASGDASNTLITPRGRRRGQRRPDPGLQGHHAVSPVAGPQHKIGRAHV